MTTIEVRINRTKDFKFSVQVARSLGGTFNPDTKTWSIPEDNWKKSVRAQRERFTIVTDSEPVAKTTTQSAFKHYRDWESKVEYYGKKGYSTYGDYYDSIA